MKKFTKLMSGTAPLVLGLAMVSAPAYAQDQDVQDADAVDEEVIVVTGSRITNPNLELSSPVGVVTSEELELRQTNVAEQFLRELPSSVPSIGSAVNNGNGGSSFVNLRNLGSQRNLVLLDGRRYVPADTTGRVDLNNIPLAVIERTDILTGGATTTYGADAISGVVNFITKRDFAGVELNLSEQLTEQGDGNVFRGDLTIGANFDDGRGNVVLSVGYQDQDAVFQGDRSFSEFNIGSFTGDAGGSSNSVPANLRGPVSAQINADGTGLDPASSNLFNFNPFNIFQTPFERYNLFSQGRYEVSDAVEVYAQASFSKQTVSTIIAPGGSFFNTYSLNYGNPYLNDVIGQAICAGDDIDPNTTGVQARTPAQCQTLLDDTTGPTLADGSPNPDYATVNLGIRRRSVEAGTRNSDFTSTVFNFVVGARGNITDSITWDLSGGYGESERIQRQSGFARFARLQNALIATDVNTCVADANVGATAEAGCVPINLLGPIGSLTQEQIDYTFSLTQQVITATSLAQVNALVSGDFGWGIAETPISFAVGGEYREFGATRRSDEASQTPGAVVGGGGAAPDITGSYDVYDAFGELVIPVLEDMPFAESLTVELGARYSDYSTAGTEFTWKAGGAWEPVAGLKIRGNYQRSSRAPNIGELFTPVTTGLSNLGQDPCAGAAPVGNANLTAICIAQGAPAGSIGIINNPVAGQVNITTGGNLNLGTETAKTWTVGFLAEPAAVPGLAVTVDYWNIEVTDAITTPSPGDASDACFVFNASPTSAECLAIRRNPLDGSLSGSAADTPGLPLNLTNLGTIETDGIDLAINYRTDITDNIGLSMSFNGTWTNKNLFQASPGSLNRECVGFYSVNCPSIQPEFGFSQRTSVTFNDEFRLSLLWRYLDGVEYEPEQFAAELAAAQADPAGCPDPLGADPGGCLVEPEFLNIGAEHYFDLTGQWEISDNVQLTLTIRNLFDNKPTEVGSDVGSTAFNSGNVYPSSYDALGRRFAAAVKFSF